jgi:uncharacterized protein (DUF1684 family)
MKTKNILLVIAVIAVVVILFYGLSGSQNNEGYAAEIKKERSEKDQFMRSGEGSPFTPEDRSNFKGLHYFEPDAKYRVFATLTPVNNKNVVVLNTSDGQQQRYLEYAYADFALDGVTCRLLLLEVMDMGPFRGKLFLAFGDETSAKETYGAGRYLDVNKVPGSTTVTLDFNKAYNPYCAYNDTYSCPFPPAENLLKVAIRAGEKSYH